jgi:hypothetical protein
MYINVTECPTCKNKKVFSLMPAVFDKSEVQREGVQKAIF